MTMEGNNRRGGALEGATYPDVVLPSQYFAPHRNQAPEQRLMIAVLHDALDCLDKHRFSTDSHDRRLFHETQEWFLADDIEWPYSFACICSVLGLDSTAVLQRLCVGPPTLTSAAGAGELDDGALAALRRGELGSRSNGASRRRTRKLVGKNQANGWDEV